MGIKTSFNNFDCFSDDSEKPPHHMGIKTVQLFRFAICNLALKNLPTTRGLRHVNTQPCGRFYRNSEKPPQHSGILARQTKGRLKIFFRRPLVCLAFYWLMSSSVRPLVSSPNTKITATISSITSANIIKILPKPPLLPTIAATTMGASMPPMRPMAPAQPDAKARKRKG